MALKGGFVIGLMILVCMAACLYDTIDLLIFVSNIECVSMIVMMVPLPSLYL